MHPDCDPWGQAFSPTYEAERYRKAGTPIAGGQFYGILDGVQGDADFIAHIFDLQSPMSH